MLSRIAESLFWIGRYVERADDTARILDAFLARLLEDPWSDEDAACRSLLAILGVTATEERRLTAGDALDRSPARGRTARAGAVPELRPGTRRGAGRARRVDDEPRRRVALPGPRALAGAGRHDRAAAVGTAADL